MPVTVRFAPSPTGNIHIGNARTALFNWLFAMKNSGRFVQRFDDTDVARSKQEYADAILYDLHWLGIFQDATEYQSRRFDLYEAAVARLKRDGLLYACYETAEELDLRRKVRRTRGLPPVYGREALQLTHAQIAEYEADGRKPHWRFMLPNFRNDPFETERTEVEWTDLVRGAETVDLASLSDPILVREDGTYLYTLPSVIDDIDMGITHVIRGDDHVTNTACRSRLFKALGAEPPEFGHHNLLTTSTGEGLSKRTGALSIASLREAGLEPMTVCSLAVLTGTSENVVGDAHDVRPRQGVRPGDDIEVGGEVRPRRPQDPEPRPAAGRCRFRSRATGCRRLASWATRRKRSGSRCAAIWKSSPMPPTGGGLSGRGPKRRQRCPTRTSPSCATPSTCCRPSPGTTTPSRHGWMR